WKRPNGLQIGQQRVAMGVIGIIYEARPNVTCDAAGLCLKTGNAVILRGGSEAINSNTAIVKVLAEAVEEVGLPKNSIQLVENTSREVATQMMKLNDYIDVLIPRGGAGLIQTVVKNATVPVIETGVGNCHIYVDEECDFEMAKNIIVNAKTSRPAVCNA
ncbi:aldehyde dehydrogenase family protein, partial [Acinetobacter baumannii]|nr:aldehyde dehydrogenase family protein [Acinetobacter baumannii]